MTPRQDIERRLAECLNATELYGVACRIEDDTRLSDLDRRELWAAHARRKEQVKAIQREWRQRNGIPLED